MKITTVLFLVFFLSVTSMNAQQNYEGIIVTKMGVKETGTIIVNLDGSNDELLSTGSKKLNIALISHVIIHDTTYYFRDIKYDYNSAYHMNNCVRLVSGTLDCGIFQSGGSYGKDNLFVKLPNDEFSKLIDIDFDYYKATAGWHLMAFSKCPALRNKMSEKQTGYKWDDNTGRDDRIAMWKQWIKEYNECKSN